MTKDRRITYSYEPLAREDGVVNHFDGKFDPSTGKLNVYRVYGDVTRPDLIRAALQNVCEAAGLRFA